MFGIRIDVGVCVCLDDNGSISFAVKFEIAHRMSHRLHRHFRSQNGRTALIKAVRKRHVRVVKLLLEYGANKKHRDKVANSER